MTTLPSTTKKKLGLVIDLDICVGCQACATSCKEWNTSGYSATRSQITTLTAPTRPGAWLNRIHSYEVSNGLDVRKHRSLPAVMPALRGARLRDRVPDGRQLQTRRGTGLFW